MQAQAVTVSITYPSINETAKAIGATPIAVQKALANGTLIKGYRLQPSTAIIRGWHKGESHDFYTLQEASKASGVYPLKLLSIIETGEEYRGWTFDEII